MIFGDKENCRNHTWLAIEEREYREEVASAEIFCHRTILQVDTMETDCSKRHKIDYETCTNLTEVSQQKCTICKVVISLAFFRNPPMSPPLIGRVSQNEEFDHNILNCQPIS